MTDKSTPNRASVHRIGPPKPPYFPGSDLEQISLEETNATRGVLGPSAVVSAGSIDYFASADGIFVFNLDREHRISQKIDPIFRGENVQPLARRCSWIGPAPRSRSTSSHASIAQQEIVSRYVSEHHSANIVLWAGRTRSLAGEIHSTSPAHVTRVSPGIPGCRWAWLSLGRRRRGAI